MLARAFACQLLLAGMLKRELASVCLTSPLLCLSPPLVLSRRDELICVRACVCVYVRLCVTQGRQVVAVANDLTFQSGAFSPREDALFRGAAELSLEERLPLVYLAANSGETCAHTHTHADMYASH